LRRQGLDVLLHPNTLAPRADHTRHALWFGQPQPLKLETLPETIAAHEDDPVLINTPPV
jgi:DOPA 4,5-dioxygenase